MSRRPGRNDPCPCGSGKKFKHCCIRKQGEPPLLPTPAKQRESDPDEALRVMRLLSKAARAFGVADSIPTTPVEVSEPIRELCATLAPGQTPVFVPVAEEPHARFGECCENVQTVVSEKGGILRSGWMIWERPNFLLCADRHACWDKDGALIDVTPKPDEETRILFLPDNTPWNGLPTPNTIVALSDKPDVLAVVEAEQRSSISKAACALQLRLKRGA